MKAARIHEFGVNSDIIVEDIPEPYCKKDLVKMFLRKGGLRCEILNSGTITLNKSIEIIV